MVAVLGCCQAVAGGCMPAFDQGEAAFHPAELLASQDGPWEPDF